MTDNPLARAFEFQSAACGQFGSAFYAALTRLIAADAAGGVRALFAPWDGQSFEDLVNAAVALRFLGAIHDLALSGDDPALAAVFLPASDAAAAWAAAKAAIARDPARFADFMAHEPQTNEVRRSACLLPGFLVVAAETRPPLACLELGASAGLNQLWSRYRYDYGPAGRWGDPAAALALTADWSGPPPPLGAPLARRQPRRLRPQADRHRRPCPAAAAEGLPLARPGRALGALRHRRGDGAGGRRARGGGRRGRLDAGRAAPRAGVATVVYHSIFWQYMRPRTQAALAEAIELHGRRRRPTRRSPGCAWSRRPAASSRSNCASRCGPAAERRLAVVQAHGATVAWDGC